MFYSIQFVISYKRSIIDQKKREKFSFPGCRNQNNINTNFFNKMGQFRTPSSIIQNFLFLFLLWIVSDFFSLKLLLARLAYKRNQLCVIFMVFTICVFLGTLRREQKQSQNKKENLKINKSQRKKREKERERQRRRLKDKRAQSTKETWSSNHPLQHNHHHI